MVRKIDEKIKNEIISLRKKGYSYSQIKVNYKISKSTLSLLLTDYPLSNKRIKELRDNNQERIEKIRNKKALKRKFLFGEAYKESARLIKNLNKRERHIAGLFLYWGEGTKSARDILALTNTDPKALLFFTKWLNDLGVKNMQMKVKLHLYSDMTEKEEIKYWSSILKIPKANFRKSYIKLSKTTEITYQRKFTHGTCMVSYGNTILYKKIMMSLKYIKDCL